MWPSCIIRIFRNWNAYFNFEQGFWEWSCSKARSVTLTNPKHFNFTPHLFSNVWFHLLHVHREKLVSHSPLHRSPDYSKYNRMGWWSVTPEPKLCSSNTVLKKKWNSSRNCLTFLQEFHISNVIYVTEQLKQTLTSKHPFKWKPFLCDVIKDWVWLSWNNIW